MHCMPMIKEIMAAGKKLEEEVLAHADIVKRLEESGGAIDYSNEKA